jgi:hypothetical protein
MILDSDSLRIDPVFEHFLVACLSILLKVQDFLVAENADNFC